MMTDEKRQDAVWPPERIGSSSGDNWLHGDFKDVAYFYVYRLFDDVVTKGTLK